MNYQPSMKLFILHVPVLNFYRINFTLFWSENINLPSENSWKMFVKLNGIALYFFMIMIRLGLLSFKLILFFNYLVFTNLNLVNTLCELWRTINFDFPNQTYPFLMKYAVKRTRCQPWKRIDKWQKWEWQKS